MILTAKNFSFRYGNLEISKDDCSYVWRIPSAERCSWVKSTPDCIANSVVQYTELLFCKFPTNVPLLFALGLGLLILWLLYLFLILGSTADNFFCPSLSVIAGILRLSENIAGVTILAFGNGAPDIFTSLATGGDEVIIMFAELIGAGIFVTTVIVGSIAVAAPFSVNLKSFLRDACFYMLAVCWISYVVRDNVVHLWEATSFVLIYVLFIVAVIFMQINDTKEEKRKNRLPRIPDDEVLQTYLTNRDSDKTAIFPQRSRAVNIKTKLDVAIAAEAIRGKARGDSLILRESATAQTVVVETRRPVGLLGEFFFDINPIAKEDWKNAGLLLKVILVLRSPVMLFLQLLIPVVNDTAVKRGWSKLLNCLQIVISPSVILMAFGIWTFKVGPVPLLVLVFPICLTLGLIIFALTDVTRIPRFHNYLSFLGFFAAMVTVYTIAGEVMAVLECIGYASGISDGMLGVTFLAWGNSIGDLISNVAIAKQGYPRMGFAACFGGPMFNTLLGLGLTYGIAAAIEADYTTKIRVGDMALGCLAFLLCSLTTSIIYLNITAATARKSYGFLLFSVYVAFMIITFLSEAHFIHALGTDHRA